MRIGTCVGLDSVEHLEQKLKALQEHGIEVCQLISWEPFVWKEENAPKVKELLEKYQITATALWMGRSVGVGFLRWTDNSGTGAAGISSDAYSESV